MNFAFQLSSSLLYLIFIAVLIITKIGKTCGDELIGSNRGFQETKTETTTESYADCVETTTISDIEHNFALNY